MGISEYRATGGNKVLLNKYHRKKDSVAVWCINFLPYKKQEYSFDNLSYGNHGIFSTNEFYPKSGSYDFRYKSIETTKTDYVKVDFLNYNGLKDSVIFKDRYGIKLKLSKDNILTFTGTQKPDTNYIYAYDNSGQRIGKLFVYTYKKQTKNVVLVSVTGAKIDKTITAEGLNKIFKPAVTEFIISEDKIEIPDLKTFTHGGSNWHSVYNSDQKLVLETYDDKIKDDNFYLFFVDNVLDKKDSLGTSVSGYMPRGYNCGFIYEGGSLHTVAHELGHGVGNLEHAFSASNSSGKTQNLMDYSAGLDLWHFQWNEVQDPSRVWMKWSKEESEGELLNKRSDADTRFYLLLVLKNKKGNDSIFYSEEETIYLNTNTEYTFKIIKRHKFEVSNKLVVTDFIFNEINWKLEKEEVKSQESFKITTTDSESKILEANFSNSEQIIGYGYNNPLKFIRVNKEMERDGKGDWTITSTAKDLLIPSVKLKWNIQIVKNPTIEFVRAKDYKGEYGFDNDYWTKESNDCYIKEKIQNTDYVFPWVSMKKDQEIKLQTIIHINEDFRKTPNYSSEINISSDDDNMSISPNVIKIVNTNKKSKVPPTEDPNIYTINNPKINEFITLNIKSSSNDESFDNPHTVYAYLNNSREKIGGFKYYSRDYTNFKEANLYVYTFFHQNGNYVDQNNLKDFLNNHSYNQAFVKWNVIFNDTPLDEKKLNDVLNYYISNSRYKTSKDRKQLAESLVEKKEPGTEYNKDDICDYLKQYFSQELNNKFEENNNYVLFITDLQPKSEPNGDIVTGYADTRIINRKYSEENPLYSVILKKGINEFSTYVHEIGHNIGLQHTYESNKDFLGGNRLKVSKNSTENFMDYSTSRLMFWKTDWEQILNNIHR